MKYILPTILLISILLTIKVLGIYFFIVSSGSMENSIKKGSIVVTRKFKDPKEYVKGDVITYKRGNQTITHRISNVSVLSDTKVFYTKGDNNSFEDGTPVIIGEIIGKVIFNIPYLGYFLQRTIDYKYIGLTMCVPLGILFGYNLSKLFSSLGKI